MIFARSLARGALFAAIGPLALAAGSLGEFWIGDIAILLVVTSAMAMTVTLIRRATFSHLEEGRGAAIDLVMIGAMTVPFLVVHDLLLILPASALPRTRHTLAATLVVLVVLIVWILRSARPPQRALAVVTIASVIVTASSFGRLLLGEIRLKQALSSSSTARDLLLWNADSAVRALGISVRPDVFVLILDAYAGDSLLQADYGVDHRPFRETLAKLGFEPAYRYTSNYSRTFASVSSLLNFSHVAQVEFERIGETQHAGFLHSLINDNRSVRFFQAAGYEVHWIPAPYFGGRKLPPTSVHVYRAWRSALAQVWTDSYLITAWFEQVWAPGVVLVALGHRTDVSAARDSALALLPRLASDRRPTFAVIHIFATHDPLVYDDRCRVDKSAVARYALRYAYAAAIRCLDLELATAFRKMITMAGDSVIIVAVGDHGPSSIRFDESRVPAESIPATIAASKFDVGAFFYIPPQLRAKFRPPRSSVNVMPAVLNAVFGANTPLQPDSRFYSKARPAAIYHFVPVSK